LFEYNSFSEVPFSTFIETALLHYSAMRVRSNQRQNLADKTLLAKAYLCLYQNLYLLYYTNCCWYD